MYYLNDACDRLSALLEQMGADGSIDEEDFRIQLGHIYSHLNCAWNGWKNPTETDTELLERQMHFPADLEPI